MLENSHKKLLLDKSAKVWWLAGSHTRALDSPLLALPDHLLDDGVEGEFLGRGEEEGRAHGRDQLRPNLARAIQLLHPPSRHHKPGRCNQFEPINW